MRELARNFGGMAVTLLCAGVLLGATPTPPVATTAAGASTESNRDWALMVRQLGSENFSERETALRALKSASTFRDRAMLSRLAEETKDEEIRVRLWDVLDEIDLQRALNPPPISVAVRDATLDETMEALSKGMGVKMLCYGTDDCDAAGKPTGIVKRYSLDGKEKSYWEVVEEMSSQHPLHFMTGDQSHYLGETNEKQLVGGHTGPIAAYPLSVARSRIGDPQRPKGALEPEKLQFAYVVSVDPRVRLFQEAQPQLTEVVDDAGKVLLHKAVNNRPISSTQINGGDFAHSWNMADQLALPAKRGGRIAVAKGVLPFRVEYRDARLEVADLRQRKVIEPYKLGDQMLSVPWIKIAEEGLEIQFQLVGSDKPLKPDDPYVDATVLDGNDKQLWTGRISRSYAMRLPGKFVEPIHLQLSSPTKMKDVELGFEMRNLPLP